MPKRESSDPTAPIPEWQRRGWPSPQWARSTPLPADQWRIIYAVLAERVGEEYAARALECNKPVLADAERAEYQQRYPLVDWERDWVKELEEVYGPAT